MQRYANWIRIFNDMQAGWRYAEICKQVRVMQ